MRLHPMVSQAFFTFAYLSTVEAQSIPAFKPVRDLVIGSDDKSSATLTTVDQVAVANNGDIFVMQRRDYAVKVFDAQGRVLRAIGRRGGGPGEFQGLQSIGLRGDTLWVADRVLNRITLFSANGKVIATLALPAQPISGAQGRQLARWQVGAMLADGSILKVPVPIARAVRDSAVRTVSFIKSDRAGGAVRPLANIDVRGRSETFSRGSLRMNLTPPVMTHDLWSLHPAGSALVVVERPQASDQPGVYVVRAVDLGGGVVFRKEFKYRPRPIPKTVRDSIFGAWADVLVKTRFLASRGAALRFVEDSIYLPRFQPPIQEVLYDANGRTWLKNFTMQTPTAVWTVLDTKGAQAMSVNIPSGARVVAADRDVIWLAETGELDIPILSRARLSPTSGR